MNWSMLFLRILEIYFNYTIIFIDFPSNFLQDFNFSKQASNLLSSSFAVGLFM